MTKRQLAPKIDEFCHSGCYEAEVTGMENVKIRSQSKQHKLCRIKSDPNIEYFEVSILSRRGVCRVGYATENAEMFGPLGYNEESFAYQMKNGYFITKSKRVVIGEKIEPGEILSCAVRKIRNAVYASFYVNGNPISSPIKVKINPEKRQLFPAFSLFGGSEIELNFGPFFSYKEKIEKVTPKQPTGKTKQKPAKNKKKTPAL